MFLNAIRVVAILASTAASAQSVQPGAAPGAPIQNRQRVGRQSQAGNRPADPLVAMREQVADMESAVSKMHATLRGMHTKIAKSKVIDPETKANLEMWELVVGHLDKELEQLRAALAQREDMEVRRAALYKQADAKAAAEAEKYRATQAAKFQAAQNGNGAAASAASEENSGQKPAPQTSVQPAVPQNKSATSPN